MLKTKKLDINKMPNHVAFIIDGNGRWAKTRGLPRTLGHKAGVIACKATIKNCINLGIKYVSIYGFSTENWNRPKEEVDALFELFREFVKNDLNEIYEYGAKFVVSGDYSKFPKDLVNALLEAMEKTKNNKAHVINLCINYGGRPEIIRAVNNIIANKVSQVDDKTFKKYLYTCDLPDPDFIVRTSGEQRISNFMIWQSAYSEFYFPKVMWPDFDKKELIKSLLEFQSRNRRFGAIKEN